MTVKQLADELGVSKVAIRKHLDAEFRATYVREGAKGVLYVDEIGCEILRTGFRKPPQTGNQFPETKDKFPETGGNLVTLKLVESLQKQLAVKDRQIEEKDRQIASLTAALAAEQQTVHEAHSLHAGTIQQIAAGTEPKKSRPWWRKHGRD